MTDEEIIAAADACGLMLFGLGMDKAKFEFCILAFAKFVGKIERFKEREACAKVCEKWTPTDADGVCPVADAIRARGEQALAQPKQDGDCKKCKDGCPACDARRQSNVLP